MQRWSERNKAKHFWHDWPEGRPSIEIGKASKICNSQITISVYNNTTGIIGNCTADGRVVFLLMDNLDNSDNLDNVNSNNLSSIQLSDGNLRCFLWPNNHEFLVAGSGTGFVLFNILNLRRTNIGDCCSTVQVLRQHDGVTFAGTQEGNVNLYDSRTNFKQVGSAMHLLRNTFHSVEDIAVSGNWIHSATARNGRVWLWDIRNLSKKVRTIETGRKAFSMMIPEAENLIYILSGGSILRADSQLSVLETINIEGDFITLPTARLHFSPPHNLFLWNVENGICTWGERGVEYHSHIGINGIEPTTHGKYILYTKNGTVGTSVLTRRYAGV